jgi:hypothetical protein
MPKRRHDLIQQPPRQPATVLEVLAALPPVRPERRERPTRRLTQRVLDNPRRQLADVSHRHHALRLLRLTVRHTEILSQLRERPDAPGRLHQFGDVASRMLTTLHRQRPP